MSTPAYENAAAMLRRQQRTTARLRVGLPALLAHFEHTELLPPEPLDRHGPSGGGADHELGGPEPADGDGPGSARPVPPADR